MLVDFIHAFSNTLRLLFEAKTSDEIEKIPDIRTKFNLEDELKGLPKFPKNNAILAGLKLISKASDDEIITNAEEGDSKLCVGYQRIERLASEIRLRITSLELEEPTNELLRDHMPPNYRSNIKDLNGAVDSFCY